ncbi:MAG: 30S ribosomal protein S12 methylthiotransferase RimO [Mailhella sp.]|nr:30S ribosomal protein S12 methylthiotransferase RimO [Mailhella sp.]
MLRICSQSLGCPKTRVDTERLLGSIGPVQTVSTPEEADLVFINTCAFIAPAVQESVQAVLQTIEDMKAMPKAKRPFLAVAGCLPGRYGIRDLKTELPEVDLWLHTDDITTWAKQIAQALRLTYDVPSGRLLSTGPSYAWLKIGEGCRHSCSFCAIPSIRGKYASEPAEALLEEARALVASGVKELVLVAQDVTAYGTDFGRDPRFLFEQLLQITGLERMRLLYLYPAGLTRELLSFLRSAGKPFVPYFDMPLQHAHPDILRRMGRPFAGNPQEAVDRIREFFPEAALRTTLMVGFPGETEEHFQTLAHFVENNRFQHLGVFAYQPEEGTEAAGMPDQLSDSLKEARKNIIMEMQKGISEEILSGYVGQRLEILVDAPSDEWPGLHTGRAWFQAPEVDGLTYISGPGVEPGAMVEADIEEAREYDMVALA